MSTKPEDTIRRALVAGVAWSLRGEEFDAAEDALDVLLAERQRHVQALESLWLNPDRPPAVIAETARKAIEALSDNRPDYNGGHDGSDSSRADTDGLRGHADLEVPQAQAGDTEDDESGAGIQARLESARPARKAADPVDRSPDSSAAEVAWLREALEAIADASLFHGDHDPDYEGYTAGFTTLKRIARAALVAPRDPSQDRETPAACYCGDLSWTVTKYGRVTHKQGCPARTDPWHQGDPFPAGFARPAPPQETP